MSAQANIVLNNGAATPVAKTFVPSIPYGGSKQPAVWLLKEGTSPLAWSRLEIGMVRNSNGTTRVGHKLIVPYVTDDPVAGPKLISKAIFDSQSGGYIIPENATTNQINDLEAFCKNLAANAVFVNWVRTFEPAY